MAAAGVCKGENENFEATENLTPSGASRLPKAADLYQKPGRSTKQYSSLYRCLKLALTNV